MHSWPFHLLTYRKRKENMGKQMSTGNWSWHSTLGRDTETSFAVAESWKAFSNHQPLGAAVPRFVAVHQPVFRKA
jgi:hypothetical protein